MGEGGSIYAGATAFGVELGRVERALSLQAFRIGQHQYHVTGGEGPHYVDLQEGSCDCADFAWRGGADAPCKHILRACLAEGEARTIMAVAALLQATQEYARGLEYRLDPKPLRITAAVRARAAIEAGHPAAALSFVHREPRLNWETDVVLRCTGQPLGRLVQQGPDLVFLSASQVRAAA